MNGFTFLPGKTSILVMMNAVHIFNWVYWPNLVPDRWPLNPGGQYTKYRYMVG